MTDAGKKHGFFIALEGIDGSGKSTHARKLAQKLSGMGHSVYGTSEPTDGAVGKLIREILKNDIDISPEALSLLFVSDRLEHAKKIKAALDAGNIVISDRYMLSTLAYQSAQGVDLEFLKRLHDKVPKPDLTILLDMDPKIAIERRKSKEKFEKLEMLAKVRQSYLELAAADKGIVIIDAGGPAQKVGGRVIEEVLARIKAPAKY